MGLFKGGVIRARQLRHLNQYEYRFDEANLIHRALLYDLADLIAKVMPQWIHPNMISLCGCLSIISQILLCIWTSPLSFGPLPSWVYFSISIGIFIYQVLDTVDGKQARKLGIQGPLGELFDHGLDSLDAFMHSILLGYIFCLEEFHALLILIVTFFGFYSTFMEVYWTSVLSVSRGIGPVESFFLMASFSCVSGVFGPQIWHYELYYLYEIALTPFRLLACSAIIGLIYESTLRYRLTIDRLKTQIRPNRPNKFTYKKHHVTRDWIKIMPIQIGVFIWSYYHQAIQQRNHTWISSQAIELLSEWRTISPLPLFTMPPQVFIFMYGVVCAHILTNSIVDRLTKQSFHVHYIHSLGILLGAAISIMDYYYSSVWQGCSHYYLLTLLFIYVAYYVAFVYQMLDSVCKYLNVSCFFIEIENKNN
jgi:phosphatidylglycerophosphate synthase